MNDFEDRLMAIAREKSIEGLSTQHSCAAVPVSTTSSPAPIPTPQKSPPPNHLTFSTIDVFTTIPFKGNQLAVVHVPANLSLSDPRTSPPSKEVKQEIAREFNFSETVFLHDAFPGSPDRGIDIFTPKEELPFAGHPVIGTICHICQGVDPPLEKVHLLCRSGRILGHFDPEAKMAEAEIPHNVRVHQHTVGGRAILKSQPHLSQTSTVTAELHVVSIVKGMSFILVSLPSVHPHLERVEPERYDIDAGEVELDEGWKDSFVGTYFYTFTSQSNEKVDRIRARMLEPSVGEDAATGSAASALACYLALSSGTASKTYQFVIQQGVEMGRASEIHVKVTLNADGKSVSKVLLAGKAQLVTQGTILLPGT